MFWGLNFKTDELLLLIVFISALISQAGLFPSAVGMLIGSTNYQASKLTWGNGAEPLSAAHGLVFALTYPLLTSSNGLVRLRDYDD